MECRLCVKGSPVVCIFKIESRFLDNIIALFKISQGDALPDMICVDCFQLLKSIEDFLKTCEESDQILRSKLISGIKQEPDVHIWDYLDSPPCEVKDDTKIVTKDFIEEKPIKQADGDRYLTKEYDVTLTQGSDTSAVVPHQGHSEPNGEHCLDMYKKNNNDKKQAHDVNNISTCDTNIDKSMDESNDTSMFKSDDDEDFFSNNCDNNINHKVKPQNKRNDIDKRKSFDKSVNDLSNTSTSGRDDYYSSDNDCVTNYNNGSTKKLVNNKQNNHKAKSYKVFKKLERRVEKINNKFEKYLCAICGTYIKDIIMHQRHLFKHSDSPRPKFKCEVCGKTFNLEENMKNHASRVHFNKFPCKVCKRKFKYSFCAVLHELRMHRNVEVHKCIVCGKVSKSKETLQVHMNIHTRIPYNAKCELCNKFYIDKRNLKRHMSITHTDERRYKCAHCPKDFKTSKHRKRHEMLHTGETPYKCPVCPKAYNQKNNMKSHFVHNHKELDYNTEMDKFIQQQKSTIDIETC